MKSKYFFSLLLLLLLLPAPALAALKAKGSVSADEAWNPAPASGDIVLPMPCDVNMVFRVMAVPAKGFLWDMTTRMGRDDTTHQERAYYDSRYTTSLSGPFAAADMPAAWRAHLPSGEYHYYFMGKYEVSGLQWKAVMDAQCPAPASISADDARPQTGISWYEALEFSRRYTEWLLEKHPAVLPRFAGDERNVGFLRLPTEAEWEYAARGAHTTPGQWMLEQDFFPMTEGTGYTDYAVFRPEDATRIEESPARIGSRKANAAGLHDTAGNAAEMVMDVFRFSLGGRLHGSAGGFVRKGGSYVSGTAEIMPGRREEAPFFQQNGPLRARDLGFRLVISGINTPGGNRPDQLKAEWKKAGENYALLLDNTRNPLEELDRLLGLARDDAERQHLQSLRAVLKDNNIALERQQRVAAESTVRNAAFMIETIRNFSIRRNIADLQITDMKKKKADNKDKKSWAFYDEIIAKAQATRAGLDKGLAQSLSFYRAKLEDTRAVPPALMDAALADVAKDLGQGDEFGKKLQDNVAIYARHVLALRKNQRQAVELKALTHDIIPPKK